MKAEHNRNKGKKRRWAARVLCLALLAAACGCFYSYAATVSVGESRPTPKVAELSGKTQGLGVIHRGEPNDSASSEREIVETACVLIEQGKFDAAGQLIEASGHERQGWKPVSELKDIVGQWDKLQKERESGREASYKEQLAAFERVKKGLPADINSTTEYNDVNDVNDVNAPTGPTAILAAITRTIEFTNEQQKEALLSDPCVIGAIASAKAEAAKLEDEGKWLDSYVRYYSWLAALEPNNKSYKDYAERLIEKAEIAGSFQDSPCETSRQRFDGVKRRIFERAVDALNFNYVNKIDYREMASKGIRRCRLLAEVVGTLTQKSNSEPNLASLGESFKDFVPDANAIAKLSSGLSGLEQETTSWSEGAGKDRYIAAFEKVLELNLTSARFPEEVVISQFAEASFSALDPYTVIVWPTYVSDFEKAMTNEFSGIGIEISKQKGQLTVASLVPDTPAYNSGLDAGDVIEKVDGVTTKDMPIGCAVKSITGPSGTKVTLTIRREGELQSRDITITRARIVVPTIRGWQRDDEGKWQYIVDERGKIGYVRLTGFSEKTASDLEDSLDSLEAAGIRGLILDLRFNSGGYFDSAVEVADDFLDDGLIVITRPRFGIPTYAAAHKKGTHPDYPMVVLVNSGSASASEIVAGALADPSHRRATLVGERTHGKGMVQGITHYPGEGAQLKYTMAYYHLPSGQRVKSRDEAEKENTNDWGVGPDVTVEMRSNELRRMFDIQRDNEVLFKAGHNADAGPLKRHSLEQTIEADPQLTTAILVIKSKLIREQAQAEKF
ncbi:MAG: S41 family peptidase [Planctomycetota bacterium]